MNNPQLTLTGTGDFSLILGSVTAPRFESVYDDSSAVFGNIKEVVIQNEQEVKEHFGSYRGLRLLDRSVTTQLRKSYKLKLDEIDHRAIVALFYAEKGSDALLDGKSYNTFVPFTQPQSLNGFARLRIWDDLSNTKPRLIHKDFRAIVRFEGDLTLGEDFVDYEIKVDVLSPVGTVYLRKD
jgi:hypothetical protein